MTELVSVWSGAKERSGEAAGLSSPLIGSAARLCMELGRGMSHPDDYKPCPQCGTLSDGGFCSFSCELDYAEEQDAKEWHRCVTCSFGCDCTKPDACSECSTCLDIAKEAEA